MDIFENIIFPLRFQIIFAFSLGRDILENALRVEFLFLKQRRNSYFQKNLYLCGEGFK